MLRGGDADSRGGGVQDSSDKGTPVRNDIFTHERAKLQTTVNLSEGKGETDEEPELGESSGEESSCQVESDDEKDKFYDMSVDGHVPMNKRTRHLLIRRHRLGFHMLLRQRQSQQDNRPVMVQHVVS